MFDRFTDRARIMIELSQHEAERLRHDHIGAGHLLLGLVKEDRGVGVTALKNLGFSSESLRDGVERIIGIGEREAKPGPLPFDPEAKRVLEKASEEARSLGHPYVGTEHMLLGLISARDGTVAQVLMNLALKAGDIRREILEMLDRVEEAPASRLDNPLVLMTNAAKDHIRDAIIRMANIPDTIPALVMTFGFRDPSAGGEAANDIEYHGKCFGIAGYREIGKGFMEIAIFGRKMIAHESVLKELQGRILDLVSVINCRNGREARVLKAISTA